MASRTFIIPDTHLRHRKMDEVLEMEGFGVNDDAIWLGDYFDNLSDTVVQNIDAAEWVKEKLFDPRYTLLIANHDIAYRYPRNRWAVCSGKTELKCNAINEILTPADWAKIKTHHVAHGILFSHAGIDRYFVDKFSRAKTLKGVSKFLNKVTEEADAAMRHGDHHWLYGAGFNRGGLQKVGGITWQDFNCLLPAKGVFQIVGHTPQSKDDLAVLSTTYKDGTPRHLKATSPETFAAVVAERGLQGSALCIDSHSRTLVVIEGNIMTIKEILWDAAMTSDHANIKGVRTVVSVPLNLPIPKSYAK